MLEDDFETEDIDTTLLVDASPPQVTCRDSRPQHWINEWGKVKQYLSYIIRFFFWSSGYNRQVKVVSKIYTGLIFLICWYQVVYEIAKSSGCPNFNCSSKILDSTKRMEFATYTAAAIANAVSYTCIICSLIHIYSSSSNGVSPYVGLKDMSNSKAKVTLVAFIVSVVAFLTYVSIYGIIICSRHYSTTSTPLYIVSATCAFIAQWVGHVSVYIFACSTFAIGSFASDILRRIHACDGNFDDIVNIYKDLRLIVKQTTKAYAPWFLLHWLLFGIVVISGFVVIALYKFGQDDILYKMYFGTFFALHVYHFIFPCVCAAYVTTVCATITTKINNTTSEDWKDDHVFKDRNELQLFVSYCLVSPVCFRIGRITFSSSLAWFSFIFGSFGILFHFFT